MNASRPAPEPPGSYEMVTSGFAVWKAAIHASCAEPCDEAPAPSMVPVRLLVLLAVGAFSFAAHDDSTRLPTTARAATLPRRLNVVVTVIPSERWFQDWAGANRA